MAQGKAEAFAITGRGVGVGIEQMRLDAVDDGIAGEPRGGDRFGGGQDGALLEVRDLPDQPGLVRFRLVACILCVPKRLFGVRQVVFEPLGFRSGRRYNSLQRFDRSGPGGKLLKGPVAACSRP